MRLTKKRVIITSIALIFITIITIGLLFAYRTDLFINYNRDDMLLYLENRKISIPLKHKYSFSSPTIKIIKTDSTVDEIVTMFNDNLVADEKLVVNKVDHITFLYLYVEDSFVEGIFIEPYGDKRVELRIGTANFVPVCLYKLGDDPAALLQNRNKLVDGKTYELLNKTYENSAEIVTGYFDKIYEVISLDTNLISVNVDGKVIILKL